MLSPDEVLDWLKAKKAEVEQIENPEILIVATVEALIEDFIREFDTEDSPVEPPRGERKKKPTRQPPDFRGPGGGEPSI